MKKEKKETENPIQGLALKNNNEEKYKKAFGYAFDSIIKQAGLTRSKLARRMTLEILGKMPPHDILGVKEADVSPEDRLYLKNIPQTDIDRYCDRKGKEKYDIIDINGTSEDLPFWFTDANITDYVNGRSTVPGYALFIFLSYLSDRLDLPVEDLFKQLYENFYKKAEWLHTTDKSEPKEKDTGEKEPEKSSAFRLRRIGGNESIPAFIEVDISVDGEFVIGRCNTEKPGEMKNHFEFDESCMTVSRNHAVITRRQDGCYIEDISKYGTVLDGKPIKGKGAVRLHTSAKVSLTHKIIYVWE